MKVAAKAAPKGTIRRKIKKGDTVVFISGKDYNRFDAAGNRVPHRGKVIAVDPRNGKVKVEGAGIIKKHQKPNRQMNIEGGIQEKEAWIDISNIALVDPESGKPTRVRYQTNDDGTKVRVAVGSGKEI
ncbi:MAG TPA: 50S ribosomal protein L24 [Pyrinomonadaceae bacterium]|nr:50S ribosomal protein L24 [Pyrinomonadaceae bacterium]